MTIKDLLNSEIDVDVCDDYNESCYIAFVGPQALTDEGQKEFESVLNLKVSVYDDIVILHTTEGREAAEVKLLRKLFKGCAGYIDIEEYNRLFKD